MHAQRKVFARSADSTRDVFLAVDRDKKGALSFRSFEKALWQLDLGLTVQQMREIFNDRCSQQLPLPVRKYTQAFRGRCL